MTRDELIERLADAEHASWARWMDYLFSKAVFEAEKSRIANRRRAIDPTKWKAPDSPEDTIGLALSGGGIRSATFCLGVMQAMAGTDMPASTTAAAPARDSPPR